MLAETINLPERARDAVTVRTEGDGAVIVSQNAPAKRVRLTSSGGETAAEPGEPVIQNGKTDVGGAVTLTERSPDAETVAPAAAQDTPVDPFAWIAAGIAAALGAATAIWYFSKKQKYSDKRSKHT